MRNPASLCIAALVVGALLLPAMARVSMANTVLPVVHSSFVEIGKTFNSGVGSYISRRFRHFP